MKEIYLAGGCYWGVEKYTSNIQGVLQTTVGFANGDKQKYEHPTYEQVKHEDTGFAETVRVCYDEQQLPLRNLLQLFFRIIDPTLLDQQGEDVGHQYRTGIYWKDEKDAVIVLEELKKLQSQYVKALVVEAEPLNSFYEAEEYHQKYLDKTPGGYCHVPLDMIAWIKTIDPLRLDEMSQK